MQSSRVISGFPAVLLLSAIFLVCSAHRAPAQENRIVYTPQEQAIADQLHGLRGLDDTVRARTTKELALQIRALPAVPNKLRLAGSLSGLSTEGDFGHDTLQEVTTTLEAALREQPPSRTPNGEPDVLFVELASLVRYEHMQGASDDPQFADAMKQLAADDGMRQNIDLKLPDLQGKVWRLQDLRGKVVMVNFWATWCPPCRKEMPDIQALYDKYKEEGLVVLAISDEDASKVQPFIAEKRISYPVLLDPKSKVHEAFRIQGIPKTFIYDRDGKLVAQSIDMRTRSQFQAMLGEAGLQ